MKIQILHVADCPNTELIARRVAQVLGGRARIQIERQVVHSEQHATELGMTGSPTLLIDSVDPFAEPGCSPSMSCRLYRDEKGGLAGAPSIDQLRVAMTRATGQG